MRASLRLLVLLLAVGCQDNPPTAVLSAMAVDPALGRVTHLRLVAERDGESRYSEVFPASAFARPGSLTFQDSSDGDDRRLLRIRFEGYEVDPRTVAGARPIISNSARLGFVKEKTKLVRLGLSRECLDVTCASADLTCRHGDCVEELIKDPDSLPDAPPGDDDDTLDPDQFTDLPQGTGGAAGAAGQGGAGVAGSSGSSGQGGLAGDGGAAGLAGMSGTSGQGGAGASGGAAGEAGQGGAGQAGEAGQGGVSGTSGQAGAGQAGDGGAGGAGPLSLVESIASRGQHTCVVLSKGQVKCWGRNSAGQLGLGDTNHRGDEPGEMGNSLPTVAMGSYRVLSLTLGWQHTCALLDGEKAVCWGSNQYGQLGLGSTQSRGDDTGEMGSALALVKFDAPVIDVASGLNHVCVRTKAKQVACWGDNQHGQLGRGNDTSFGNEPAHVPLDGIKDVPPSSPPISDNPLPQPSNWTCAHQANGLECWGHNNAGQLGLGDTENRGDTPDEMMQDLSCKLDDSKTQVKQVATGAAHACAILDGGRVKCWGYNNAGQLGLGTDSSKGDNPDEMGQQLPDVPVALAKQVVVGDSHSCALLESGAVVCWGSGTFGQLGTGNTAPVGGPGQEMFTEVNLGSGSKAKQLSAGSNHTCALLDSGLVKCWGRNVSGELGLGDTNDRGDEPGEMGDALPFVDLGSSLLPRQERRIRSRRRVFATARSDTGGRAGG